MAKIDDQKNQPRIEVDDTLLDFGTLDHNGDRDVLAQQSLMIKNSGGGVLAGKVIPQFEWVVVSPVSFHLPAGQSGEFIVSLTSRAPLSSRWRNISKENLLFINSSAGAITVGGRYLAAPFNPTAAPFSSRQIIIYLSAVLLFFILMIAIGMAAIYRPPTEGMGKVDLLYTQGARTIIARLTRTQAAPIMGPSPASTIVVQFGSTSVRTTVTTGGTPAVVIETQPPSAVTPTETFTPWPRNEYPNPEQFVIDYYEGINARSYEATWSRLAPAFQETCCSIAGNNPFLVYQNWWDSVERVVVLSAYIQDWNANPAVVHAHLRYFYRSGDMDDMVHIIEIVAEEESGVLLINQVY